ncbi:MAG: 50S ribosomal protein L17 [Candidatus Chisholmbacteria bacterium]|nr:50S ribosomal protein L17 [Candidatus Chisholmbacteria bacterium]
MRHQVFGRHLKRSAPHRQALFKNLVVNLITHGHLKTSQAKYKAVKGLIDKLVVKAQKKTVHSRRVLLSFLNNKKVVNLLVDDIAPKLSGRMSGFTRSLPLSHRRGDDTLMVRVTFAAEESLMPLKTKLSESKKAKEQPKAKKQPPTQPRTVFGPKAPLTTKTTPQVRRTTHK